MSQKALVLQAKFGSFTVTTVPKPTSALKGELLVKVQASALNPVDWKIQEYGWFVPDDEYPAIMGIDIAGDVEDVGEGVTGFEKGDRVFFSGSFFSKEYAGHQQFSRISAEIAAKIPTDLSYSQAATIPLGFLTAAVGLYANEPLGLGLNPTLASDVKEFSGKTALVIGGSTSVGQYAIQLLRYLGVPNIIAYASAHQFSYLRTLGATTFVDRREVSFLDLPAAIKKVSSTAVELVYDAFSSCESQCAGYSVLSNGGKMVIVLPDEIEGKVEGDGKKIVHALGSAQPDTHREFGKRVFETFPKLIEEGTIVPNRVEDLQNGLEGILDGLKRLRNNEVSGVKLVAHPQETK
ncbi:hypothetical protein VKT23_013713 [Stygiomarasmius scandens]|uniref:Enoyl reductase (ER) domain-containing protein n=1 Tax=Marasmiellus scandens TaxID=2682957 RepID=A0ABR1J538_9AGAR